MAPAAESDERFEPTKFGWGGRIRASVRRDQNPQETMNNQYPISNHCGSPGLFHALDEARRQGVVVERARFAWKWKGFARR
jgi:hypothetical protein